MKKILFATSECVPFIKTGGLADVAGSLPKYFDKEKYDVRVMLPKYMCMKDEETKASVPHSFLHGSVLEKTIRRDPGIGVRGNYVLFYR